MQNFSAFESGKLWKELKSLPLQEGFCYTNSPANSPRS